MLFRLGKCQSYIKVNGDCFSAGYGSCGCEPNTKCVNVAELEPVPLPQQHVSFFPIFPIISIYIYFSNISFY